MSIFNAKDAMRCNNAGRWNQNAIVVKDPSFDFCPGHPAGAIGPHWGHAVINEPVATHVVTTTFLSATPLP